MKILILHDFFLYDIIFKKNSYVCFILGKISDEKSDYLFYVDDKEEKITHHFKGSQARCIYLIVIGQHGMEDAYISTREKWFNIANKNSFYGYKMNDNKNNRYW